MGQWSKEKAWSWYNARPWIRGCNFLSSDCANRVDQWQEFGFEERLDTARRELELMASIGYNSVRLILEFDVWDREHDGFMKRLDRYLEAVYSYGITAMLVLSNECSVRTLHYAPLQLGPQKTDPGCHGGKKLDFWFKHGDTSRENVLDFPEAAERYHRMVREIITEYAHDPRVVVWNLMNEPGNGRGTKSLPHLEKFFETAWSIDPDQPLCADVWRGMKNGKPITEMETRALELSDIISFHNYGTYENNIAIIEQLREYGRPMINTEWLNRMTGNSLFEMLPLFYLENIGSYNWGFVAGKYQTYEPSQNVWLAYETKGIEAVEKFDFTKWMHDLYRPGLHPYDPREIELIKKYSARADEKFRERQGKIK